MMHGMYDIKKEMTD